MADHRVHSNYAQAPFRPYEFSNKRCRTNRSVPDWMSIQHTLQHETPVANPFVQESLLAVAAIAKQGPAT